MALIDVGTTASGERKPIKEYIGLSTDTKPIGLPIGSTVFEWDTGTKYVNKDGANWVASSKHTDAKLRVSSMDYLKEIAEGHISGHYSLRVLGSNPDVDAALEDLWPIGGSYVFPTAGMGMEAVSGAGGAQDFGVIIKSGTSDSITSVEGTDNAWTLTLTDADVDFTAVTAVVAGDAVLFDGDCIKGQVQTVAAHVLTVRVWMSSTVTSVQAYRVEDDSAGGTGIRLIHVHYLDTSYAEQCETVVMNGTTPVATTATDILRVNSMHSVKDGSAGCAADRIDLRHLDDTPIYRSIPAGLNTDEDGIWTVPTKTVAYITLWQVSGINKTAGRPVRFWLRMTCDNHPDYSGNKWHTKDIALMQDIMISIPFGVKIKAPARTNIKISCSCDETNAVTAGLFEGYYKDA